MKKALKLHNGHIRLGKPLPWNVYDNNDQLLLTRGYVIEREAQLVSLLERGMYVDAAEFDASVERPRTCQAYDPFWVWDDLTAKLAFQLTHAPHPEQFQRVPRRWPD